MSIGYDGAAETTTTWHGDSPVYDRGETVCVIGAGASGLLAVRNLLEQGFGVDCYERETGVGGAWNWRHDRSPIHAGVHLRWSREATQFPDFPMPDSWPDFPHHSQILSYLEHYAEHFNLRRHIWFGTEVVRVRPATEDRWDVTTRSTGGGTERIHRYAAVVVANGHHRSPNLPEYEGMDRFAGEVIHANAVKDLAKLRGRRVLVVGGGSTGAELAAEAAHQATTCWHSTRRGYWYIPKYLLGRPVDRLNALTLALRLPLRLRQWLFHRVLKLTVGNLTRFGLPAPDHKVFETHPMINSQLLYWIGHGRVTPVPDIARFERNAVVLGDPDHTEIEPDLVILATGYLPQFEFLDPELLGLDDAGRPRLLMHTFSRRHSTLAVAGLIRPDTGTLPLVYWQTRAIARWLRQRRAAPELAAACWARISAEPDRRWTKARTVDSPRHWFETSHTHYLGALQAALDSLEAKR